MIQLRKDLNEVLEQKDTLITEVATVTRESDTHKADLEASQEEIGLLKEQMELKDQTIQRLRSNPGKAIQQASAQETEVFQKEIRDLQM